MYELSCMRVNQDKHNKYFQEHKALAHSNGCKMFTNRNSGRNQTLEEQPWVRMVPSVTRTYRTQHVWWTRTGVASLKFRPVSQKLSCENWTDLGNTRGTSAFSWEGQGRGPPAAQQESSLHWTRCSCICLNKRYNFCPHKCCIIDVWMQILDEVHRITHLCIWRLHSLRIPWLDTALPPSQAVESRGSRKQHARTKADSFEPTFELF